MRADVRMIVVDESSEALAAVPRLRVLGAFSPGDTVASRERDAVLSAQDEGPTLTLLVEWFQTLAGAEWQWT